MQLLVHHCFLTVFMFNIIYKYVTSITLKVFTSQEMHHSWFYLNIFTRICTNSTRYCTNSSKGEMIYLPPNNQYSNVHLETY